VEIMEQYIHTLIAADSAFVPQSKQIAEFFEILTATYNFRIISDTGSEPGLRVMKPSGRLRRGRDPMTGEAVSIPMLDHIKIERINDIPGAIEGLEHYSVLASGEWTVESRPLVLLTTDEVPFEDTYLCCISCHIRPEPVSTSCWDEDAAGPNSRNVPYFGEACEPGSNVGIFSHPWTGELIEVPDAGCARFWIELEFGKWLLPKMADSLDVLILKMADSLDVLSPVMVAKIEECFATGLVQGYRFN
jgi:hypothetical protein